MNRIHTLLIILVLLLFSNNLSGFPLGETADTTQKPKQFKKGWKPLPFPIIGYNTDIGFQYGLGLDLPYYGDGSTFPKYLHSFYFEASFTTKGGSIFQFFYDSEKLIKNLRVTADVSYLTEQALDFYGFNGYHAVYNHAWEDDKDTASYKTRVFYRHERKLFKFALSLQGKFLTEHLHWMAGATIMNFVVGSVDTTKLNKGQKEDNKLPDVPGLYDNYVSWGVLSQKESSGGMNNFIKLGLIYDTRDNEANPMRGLWSEVNFLIAPKFLGDGNYGFIKLAIIHRQYFTLIRDKLTFVYRIAFQGTIAGDVPFYIQPLMINSWEKTTTIDGLGGSRNIRGILRNRVVGDGDVYANAEFRWKFLYFNFLKQPCYFAANVFSDAGMVVQDITIDKSRIPDYVDQSTYFSSASEYPHITIGAGLKIAYNENTVLSADLGYALDKRDGSIGIYIGFGFLF
jgi:outer membrane protein assembly factor BamA